MQTQQYSQKTIEEMATLIFRYLQSHPEAADTIEGIARWWITRQRYQDSLTLIRLALNLLVKKGIAQTRSFPNGQTVYMLATLYNR